MNFYPTSMKHAFPGKKEGEINLEFGIKDDEHFLIIRDDGIGFPSDVDYKNTSSLGLQLVNTLIHR